MLPAPRRRRGTRARRRLSPYPREGTGHPQGQWAEETSTRVRESPCDLTELSPDKRRKIRQYYANLELPFGATLAEVKQAYRQLMRQYHPDKHPHDPARRELATQLSQKLTVAYNELNQILRSRDK